MAINRFCAMIWWFMWVRRVPCSSHARQRELRCTQTQVRHNHSAGQCRLYYSQGFAVLQRRGRTAVPPDVAFGGWTARRSLTGNCLKSPSREHGQAALTSDAAGQVSSLYIGCTRTARTRLRVWPSTDKRPMQERNQPYLKLRRATTDRHLP